MTQDRKPSDTIATVRFSDAEVEALKEMQDDMHARTRSEVVRKSVAQTSALRKLADDDKFLNILDEDGKVIRFPINW